MKLILQFYKVLIKSKLEYRFNFFMEIFINISTYVVVYLGMWVILNKFGSINGWSYYQIMLLYNFNLITYGMACLLFYMPMRSLDNMVQTGEFDNILTRPLNPFLHLILKQGYLGFLGHIVLGIFVFAICFNKLHIHWNITVGFIFVLFLIGATLIQASVIIFSGTLSLKFVQALSVMDTLIYNIRGFINYPISIYDKWIEILLTFILPYAFVNFFPSEFLLGKQSYQIWNPTMKFGSIIIGVVLFTLSYRFFCLFIKKYQSTGS